MTDSPIWSPSEARIARSNMNAYLGMIREEYAPEIASYAGLHRWSVSDPEAFWPTVWAFCGVRASQLWDRVLESGDDMAAARFFPGARLNFADNLLRHGGGEPAVIFRSEAGHREALSFDELYGRVAALAAAFRRAGLEPGDRVAAYMPNRPETLIAMLAATSCGAIFSSCSPDFGSASVLDRFGQIEPRILITADGYFYGGKARDSLATVRELAPQLPSIERVLVVPYVGDDPDLTGIPGATLLDDFADDTAASIEFEQLPFDHPVYILYSSGTTGPPKAIVHGAGGTLVQHLKEHVLHTDLGPGERLFYFTTCGWMMWNWQMSALAAGATLVLYDGSPFHPDPGVLWRMAEEEGITVFGTSARYLTAQQKAGMRPGRDHDLGSVHTLLSTGSPLPPEGYDYVYGAVSEDVLLASISGGTEIVACFALGNPVLPVYRGELQGPGLGMRVEVFDDEGRSVRGQKGELVCTAPFPSMPAGFWNDPDGGRYRRTYFETFPGVWRHGDYAELTERDTLIIHGRSDAVLNPGGVRIGTAEIYRPVEALEEIAEAVAVGQRRGDDERVVLFVRPQPGVSLDDTLAGRIRRAIRDGASPRHVPARILAVDDIPRTKNGKISEIAVRRVVHGEEVANREALDNPEALEQFRGRPELAE